MFKRIAYTWRVIVDSWSILRNDKTLLWFPLLSSISCILLFSAFAWPLSDTILEHNWKPDENTATPAMEALYYVLLFTFYFINYLIITFFNVALTGSAFRVMKGEDTTLAEGLREATNRIHLIVGWAFLAATVGMILNLLGNRFGRIASFVSSLLGMAFTLAQFLVVPVLVAENKSPIDALKESARLLKKTWGEQIISSVSFGIIFFFLTFFAVIATIAIGAAIGGPDHRDPKLYIILGIAFFMFLTLSGIVQSTLQSIFRAALYRYSANGDTSGYDRDLLDSALRRE